MDEPALAPQPRLPHAASLPPAGTGTRPLFAGVWRHVLRRGLSATPTRARWLRCTSSHGRRHNPRPTARRPHPSTRTDTRSQLLVSVLPSQLGRLLAFTVREGATPWEPAAVPPRTSALVSSCDGGGSVSTRRYHVPASTSRSPLCSSTRAWGSSLRPFTRVSEAVWLHRRGVSLATRKRRCQMLNQAHLLGRLTGTPHPQASPSHHSDVASRLHHHRT